MWGAIQGTWVNPGKETRKFSQFKIEIVWWVKLAFKLPLPFTFFNNLANYYARAHLHARLNNLRIGPAPPPPFQHKLKPHRLSACPTSRRHATSQPSLTPPGTRVKLLHVDHLHRTTPSTTAPTECPTMQICDELALFDALSLDQHAVRRFALLVEEGYQGCPYHNKVHAAAVTLSIFQIILASGIPVGPTSRYGPMTPTPSAVPSGE